MFEKVTSTLDEFLALGVPFYDCIVMKNGKCVYRHAGGFTDSGRSVAVRKNEKYNIYSCSKLITCVAALQLYERGLFSLDDKLSDYMPEFEHMTVQRGESITPAINPIRIRHLFMMSAGFSYNLKSPQILLCQKETDGRCPTRELMRYLAREPLFFEPGERWEYSLCHDVLAALVEVISGKRFGEYVKENIFEPLGMTNSTFLLDDASLEEIVPQYIYREGEGIVERDKHIDYKLGTEYESGGAGCISTVDDYIKLLEALRIGDIILKKETVDLLATNALKEENRGAYWLPAYGYGLGQRCPKDDEKSDFGWSGAAGAYYAIDRGRNLTYFMATHILSFEPFQRTRSVITQIIQESSDEISNSI